MQIYRFFVNPKDIGHELVTLTGGEFYHATRVLRQKVGFKIIVCCGDGFDYECVIESVEKHALTAKILQKTINTAQPKIKLNLYVCINKKLDLIVQKAAELGAAAVIPVISERSEKTADITRLNRIAVEACKQCGRADVMKIQAPVIFNDACNHVDLIPSGRLNLMCYEREDTANFSSVGIPQRLAIIRRNQTDGVTDTPSGGVDFVPTVNLFVGSEGGFTDNEAEHAKGQGVEAVSLGKRILRAETAAVAAMTLTMFLAGELRP